MTIKKSLISIFLLGLISFGLFSCNDEDTNKSVRSGKLAQKVSGLTVISGSTVGESSNTGAFFYEEGELVDIWVGELKLGNGVQGSLSLNLDSLFTDGVNDHRFKKAVQILSVLDDNLDITDGIQILSSTVISVNSDLKNINLASSDADFDSQYSTLVNSLKSVNSSTTKLEGSAALISFQKWEIGTYIDSQILAKKLPGVSLSIELPNGETYNLYKGLANIAANEAITADHQYRIGSATKSFVGMAIMQLVGEGKLSLDDTVEKYFPGKFPNGSSITVKNLIRHTAGIFSFTSESPGYYEAFDLDITKSFDDLWFIKYIVTPSNTYTNDELIDIGSVVANTFVPTVTKTYFINEPGKAWNYSNTHYVMLGDIIEQITGNTWEQEVTSRFIVTLGLNNTKVPLSGESTMTGTFASGYVNWVNNLGADGASLGFTDTDIDRSTTDPSFTGSSGTMISTSEDMLKWSNAVMEGQLLDTTTQALMMEGFDFSAFSTNGEMLHGVVHDKDNKLFGHRGQIVGYDASWQYRYEDVNDIVGTGTAMAVLINRTMLIEGGHVSNANEIILLGVLDILYGANATSSKKGMKQSNKKNKVNLPGVQGHLNEY